MSQTAVVARAPSFNIRRTCRISMMYNLRKRKAPILGPFPKTAAAGGAQPHARGLSAPAEEGGSSAAAPSETEEDLDAASAAPAAPSPAKPKQWEDVGLKVDTSQLLLGMGPLGPSPTADAALMSSPAATAALARSGMSHETLQRGVDHLATADPKLVPYIQQYGLPVRLLTKTSPTFASLSRAIAFQQLATGAAAAIFGRVLQACQCTEQLTPEALTGTPVEALRSAGLSERKVSYLLDLCRHYQEGHLSDELIAGWDDARLQQELTKVKGIGAWTCDMFAMFHLGHPDVLPLGDLGVRRGMQVLYSLKDLPDAEAMQRISDRWRPFRSIGSYYMWRVEVPRALQKKKAKKKASSSSSSNDNRAPL